MTFLLARILFHQSHKEDQQDRSSSNANNNRNDHDSPSQQRTNSNIPIPNRNLRNNLIIQTRHERIKLTVNLPKILSNLPLDDQKKHRQEEIVQNEDNQQNYMRLLVY